MREKIGDFINFNKANFHDIRICMWVCICIYSTAATFLNFKNNTELTT